MNLGPSGWYLSPRALRYSDRASSGSWTDPMSNMQREQSNSSHVTESSHTTHYIHSQPGDSIHPSQPVPSYLRQDCDAFCWHHGSQTQAEDHRSLATTHQTLVNLEQPFLAPETLPLEIIPAPNDGSLNIDSNVAEADALFNYTIRRMQQEYNMQSDRLTYARSFARAYLGLESTLNNPCPVEQPSRAQPGLVEIDVQNTAISDGIQRREQYLCLLCLSPTRYICNRGAFKRHVNEMHQPKSIFLCMYENCSWQHCRKDKFRNHLQVRHPRGVAYTQQEIKDQELMLDVPSTCELCLICEFQHRPPFESWQEWFEGIVAHCRIGDDEERTPDIKINLPEHDNGDEGGAAGGGFQNLPSPKFSNGSGTSSNQGSEWIANSQQWTYNTHTRCGTQEFCEDLGSPYEPGSDPHGTTYQDPLGSCVRLCQDARGPPSRQLSKLSFPASKKKNQSTKFDCASLGLFNRIYMLYFDDKPRVTFKSPGVHEASLTKSDSKFNEKALQKKSVLLLNVIHQLTLAALHYLIRQISLHPHGAPNKISDHSANCVAIDHLVVGETTLSRIYYYENSIFRRILFSQPGMPCASLNAILGNRSGSTLSSPRRQQCKPKRLSSLWTRVRAVILFLSLQKLVDEKGSSFHIPTTESQLDLMAPSHKAIPPSTVHEMQSSYTLVPNYLPETYTTSTNATGNLELRTPVTERSQSMSDRPDFLHALMSSISIPQSSLMEFYENTRVYDILHYSLSNFSTASF